MKNFNFKETEVSLYYLNYKKHEDKDLNYINFYCEERKDFFLDVYTWSTKFSGYNTLSIEAINELNTLAKFLQNPSHSKISFGHQGPPTLEKEIKVLTCC
jgi:hypothetical protein